MMFATQTPTETFELGSAGQGNVVAFLLDDDEVAFVGTGPTPFAALADALEVKMADAAWRAQHPEPCAVCTSKLHETADCRFAAEVAA